MVVVLMLVLLRAPLPRTAALLALVTMYAAPHPCTRTFLLFLTHITPYVSRPLHPSPTPTTRRKPAPSSLYQSPHRSMHSARLRRAKEEVKRILNNNRKVRDRGVSNEGWRQRLDTGPSEIHVEEKEQGAETGDGRVKRTVGRR